MNACTFRLSMDSGEGIQIAKCTPEEGSIFSVSGGGLVSVQFNRAVNMSHQAKVVAGEKEASVAVNGQANIYSMEIKEILSYVDHTLLAQNATWDEIKSLLDDGIKYG